MKKHISLIFYTLAFLTTIFIFSMSLKPAYISSKESAFYVDFLLRFIKIDEALLTNIVRKLAHFVEFFTQASFLCLGFIFSHKYFRRIIYVLLTGLITAITDEFLQLFTPGRAGMISDVFIDFSAVIFSVILWAITLKLYNNFINRRKK